MGQCSELWERMENCGTVQGIVRDERIVGDPGDCGTVQGTVGDKWIVGQCRELWEMRLWESMETCGREWRIVGEMEECERIVGYNRKFAERMSNFVKEGVIVGVKREWWVR